MIYRAKVFAEKKTILPANNIILMKIFILQVTYIIEQFVKSAFRRKLETHVFAIGYTPMLQSEYGAKNKHACPFEHHMSPEYMGHEKQ